MLCFKNWIDINLWYDDMWFPPFPLRDGGGSWCTGWATQYICLCKAQVPDVLGMQVSHQSGNERNSFRFHDQVKYLWIFRLLNGVWYTLIQSNTNFCIYIEVCAYLNTIKGRSIPHLAWQCFSRLILLYVTALTGWTLDEQGPWSWRRGEVNIHIVEATRVSGRHTVHIDRHIKNTEGKHYIL